MTNKPNISHQADNPGDFPQEVLDEANSITLKDELFENRRQVEGITIDGEHSMDLDDAVHVTRKEQGYLVTVSIADVAALIQQDSYIDKEALKKITTKYLRYSTKPLLPHILSEGFLSLLQGKLRPTISVNFLVSPHFTILGQSIDKTYIKSSNKMSYPTADMILSADPEDPNYDMLRVLDTITRHTSSQRLTQKRRIETEKQNQRVFIDENGIERQPDDENPYNSHLIIQELMISANVAIAEILNQNKIPTLFRNHKRRRRNGTDYGKASYGVSAQGHSALRVPAYTHSTSPIRRYPDIVVQRSLHSLINGTKPPRNKRELGEVAKYINSRLEEFDRERTEYLRQKSAQCAKDRIFNADAEEFVEMEAVDFMQILKMACQNNLISAIMADGILRRYGAGKIRDIEMYYILFESAKNHPIWQAVRSNIVSGCIHQPGAAIQILEFARARHKKWRNLQIDTKEKANIHTAEYSIEIDGDHFFTEASAGERTSHAKNQAAKALLCKYFGIQIPTSTS